MGLDGKLRSLTFEKYRGFVVIRVHSFVGEVFQAHALEQHGGHDRSVVVKKLAEVLELDFTTQCIEREKIGVRLFERNSHLDEDGLQLLGDGRIACARHITQGTEMKSTCEYLVVGSKR